MARLIKTNHFPRPIIYLDLITAFFLALLAGWLSMHASRAYYHVAPFHYDSAYYLFRSIQLYDIQQAQGKWAALLQVFQFDKDFLDTVLRIIFFPSFLQTLHGHMVIALPLMVLFIFLTLHYVYQRTGAWVPGLAVVGFLFCFYFIYVPFQGIADYWKESVAMWALGSAVITWLLSNGLRRPHWSLLCGTLLGALVMERTGLALYAAMLWLPLFLIAFYQRLQQDTLPIALARAAAFVLPALVLTAFVAIMQWQLLYHYYFEKGYDYVSFFQAAKQILWSLYHYNCFRFPILLIVFLIGYSLFYIKNWHAQWRDLAITTWLAAGFPTLIAVTCAIYNGFYNSWSMLLITFFATLVPVGMAAAQQKKYAATLIMTVIAGSFLQYQLSSARTQDLIEHFAGQRNYYEKMTDIIMGLPEPRIVTFLVDEDFALFFDHLKLNRGIALNEIYPMGFMSVHDSYYHAEFSKKADQIKPFADSMMQDIETSDQHNIIIAYCTAADVFHSPVFPPDGRHTAMPVVAEQTRYLTSHPEWHVVQQIDSPYGCVDVYQLRHNI